MMEVIASDELYSVAEFDDDALAAMGGGGGGGANDMSRYLSSETGLAARRRPVGEDGEEGAELGKEGEGKERSGSGAGLPNGGQSTPSDGSLQSWAGAAIAQGPLSIKLQKVISPEAWSFDIFECVTRPRAHSHKHRARTAQRRPILWPLAHATSIAASRADV